MRAAAKAIIVLVSMNCPDCPRFDKEENRCKDGKVNPSSHAAAVEVANVLGVRSICTYNDFRERIIAGRNLSIRKSGRFTTD